MEAQVCRGRRDGKGVECRARATRARVDELVSRTQLRDQARSTRTDEKAMMEGDDVKRTVRVTERKREGKVEGEKRRADCRSRERLEESDSGGGCAALNSGGFLVHRRARAKENGGSPADFWAFSRGVAAPGSPCHESRGRAGGLNPFGGI